MSHTPPKRRSIFMFYDTISKSEMLDRYDKRVGIVIIGIKTKDIEEMISKYKKKLEGHSECYNRTTLIKRNDGLVDCAMSLGDKIPFDNAIGDRIGAVIESSNNVLPMNKYINRIRNIAILD